MGVRIKEKIRNTQRPGNATNVCSSPFDSNRPGNTNFSSKTARRPVAPTTPLQILDPALLTHPALKDVTGVQFRAVDFAWSTSATVRLVLREGRGRGDVKTIYRVRSCHATRSECGVICSAETVSIIYLRHSRYLKRKKKTVMLIIP